MRTFIHTSTCAAAISALLLVTATGMSKERVPDEVLQREWIEIQVNGDREARAGWWRDLDFEQLDTSIQAGVDVSVTDRRGWTPLHSAARYNSDPEVVSALLRAGATVDAKDSAGDTALHWAAAENTNVEIISCLLEAGADVNATDKYGWLPIHTAAERNSNPDVIETLLGAGAERDRRAYFVLFRPRFLLKHNSSMSDKDKRVALALLDEPD